ncbi:putative leucine-rich repeat receptor-like protein kinase [Vitis vinifera]|uniref:Putative leucine-rich repeat receptor-like protein kinase n=1 Tax=Vitis vinifera TaxID=29760 RepID=A0A438C6P0_VITVI|nr:putative leucine-rich repeat receptor-like protein kinase [Vitis vinifera]
MLQKLFLDSNALAFNIPTSLWSLRDLLVLNLSSNFLTGNLPPEVGNMKSITTLDLSKNLVSGYIPSRMGKLQSLITLSLSQNRLQGPIPVEFGDLVSLESLDLSQNNLSGIIPQSLEALIYLKRDNMEIPTPIHSWLPGTHEKISHQQLLYATNHFGEDNLIGKGSQGMSLCSKTKTLGTIGYMAPEHGSDGIVSTKSDVYSYGILLMEVFARKKPMDEMFTGDLTLKTWVESLSNSVIQVVDANLLGREMKTLPQS